MSVGVPRGTYAGGQDLALIAAVHELGTSTVPARPFVAPTVREQRSRITQMLRDQAAAALAGDDPDLRPVGEHLVTSIRARVLGVKIPPPLKPATVRRKGHSQTLVGDPGAPYLANAITYRLVAAS